MCLRLVNDKDFIEFIIGQKGDLSTDNSIVGSYRRDCLEMLINPHDKKDKTLISAGLAAVNKLVEEIHQIADSSDEQ